MLETAAQFDQLDLVNIAGAEFLIRRVLQLEAATRRNPRQVLAGGATGSTWRGLRRVSRVCVRGRRRQWRVLRYIQGGPGAEMATQTVCFPSVGQILAMLPQARGPPPQ